MSYTSTPRLPPGYLRRPRLIDLLDDCAAAPLVVVDGPAGSGKTALVTDWVRHRGSDEATAWLTLDESVRTPAAVWAAAAAAVLDDAPARVGHARLAAMFERDGRTVNLVLDDLHLGTPGLFQEIARLAALLRRCRVIALTRVTDSLDRLTLQVRIERAVVTADQLAWTVEETASLAATMAASAGPPADAATLHNLTGGHALLTRLALATDDPSPVTLGRLAADWAVELVPPGLRALVLPLALVPVVDEALVAAIAADTPMPQDGTAPDGLLDVLALTGLGAIDDRRFFRFHPAIGAALAAHAEAALAPDARHRVRTIAADHLRRTPTHVASTLRLLVKVKRLDDLWPHFASSFGNVASDDLVSLLDAIPDEVASNSSAAAVVAVLRSCGEGAPSADVLAIVDGALKDLEQKPVPEDPDAAAFHHLSVQALLYAARRFEAGADRVDILLETASRLKRGEHPARSATNWGLLYSAVLLVASGRLNRALRLLDELAGDRDPLRRARGIVLRGFIHAMRGEIVAAAKILDDHRTSFDDRPDWRARGSIARAAIELERGDAPRALKTLRSVEDDLSRLPEWPFALTVIARTHLAIDPVEGIEDIDRLQWIHGDRPMSRSLRDILHSAIADLALAAGDVARAKRLIQGHEPEDTSLRLTAARIALATPSNVVVQDLRRLAQQSLWPRLRAQTLLLLAVHQQRLGDSEVAQEALRRALAITLANDIRLIHALSPRGELQSIAAAAGVELPPNVNAANPVEPHLMQLSLTTREAILLGYLATPARLKEIAAAEFVSLSTIKSQAASLYRKLGVTSRRDAVEEALRRGVLDLET